MQNPAVSRVKIILLIFFVINFLHIQGTVAQSIEKEPFGLECFMILAGKNTTVDGSVLVAHNLDLGRRPTATMAIYPRERNSPDEKEIFSTGLRIPEVEETYGWIVLRIARSLSSNNVAVNEHQVALAGGLNLMSDRNLKAREADPVVQGGVDGYARNVALKRAKTAREAVEILGDLYTKYGNTYPCAVGYADPEEIWYIESGGGRHWAAVKVPDDCYWIQANGYRIGEINPEDTENVITSPDLLESAKEKGLWKR